MERANKLGLGAAAVGLGIITWAGWPSPRERFLRAARGELGNLDWTKYLPGVVEPPITPGDRPYWCGIFSLWALHKAGFACDVKWNLLTGRGFLHLLPATTDPKPGDMAYLHSYQHHAIVEKVEGGMVQTIDGNWGPEPNRVRRVVRPMSDVAFFYDTTPLFERPC